MAWPKQSPTCESARLSDGRSNRLAMGGAQTRPSDVIQQEVRQARPAEKEAIIEQSCSRIRRHAGGMQQMIMRRSRHGHWEEVRKSSDSA